MRVRVEIPFLIHETLNVWRRTCGDTGLVMAARLATCFTIRWIVLLDNPNVSARVKLCSRSRRTLSVMGKTLRLVFFP